MVSLPSFSSSLSFPFSDFYSSSLTLLWYTHEAQHQVVVSMGQAILEVAEVASPVVEEEEAGEGEVIKLIADEVEEDEEGVGRITEHPIKEIVININHLLPNINLHHLLLNLELTIKVDRKESAFKNLSSFPQIMARRTT